MSNGAPTQHYMRVNVLIALAFIIVILCLAVTVWEQITDEFAKGILTLVLGRYLGYVDNIYNFEFGTTRSSTKKDETITELTKTAAVVANTAAGAPTNPPIVENMEVKATGTVEVNQEKDK